MREEIAALVADADEFVARTMSALDDLLTSEGCHSYVKTIYAGYELGGSMVAAAYPRAGWVEVALALPEDIKGHLLVDATHLTWRTMPVAVAVREDGHLDEALRFASQAADRVRRDVHDVERPPEHFHGRG